MSSICSWECIPNSGEIVQPTPSMSTDIDESARVVFRLALTKTAGPAPLFPWEDFEDSGALLRSSSIEKFFLSTWMLVVVEAESLPSCFMHAGSPVRGFEIILYNIKVFLKGPSSKWRRQKSLLLPRPLWVI